jgi:hypothetical protein
MKKNTTLEQHQQPIQTQEVASQPEVSSEVQDISQEQNQEQHEQQPVKEQPEKQEDQTEHPSSDTVIKPTPQPKTVIIPQVKDALTNQIEKIMESGLVDAFKEMNEIQKQEFKVKGEQSAKQIKELLGKSKVKIKKIYEILVAWLQIIPGISRFFIQQEAKIKADKLLALRLHQTLNQ